jgi:hypothetical protein
VAADRQGSTDDSVRDIAAQSMGQIFEWITLFNFGEGVAPPRLEFFRHEKAGKERAETYELVARMGARPSKSALLEELAMPAAENDEDALVPPAEPAPPTAPGAPPAPGAPAAPVLNVKTEPLQVDMCAFDGIAGFEFARAAGMTVAEALALATAAADNAIEDRMIAPVAQMLASYEAQGKTLAEFKAAFEAQAGTLLDDEGLREVLDRALSYSILVGAATKVA